ncbi:MAG TPA: HAD-IA family hydrolase [Anaerolineales bacterium]|nr:HAD-IA family hydrolase [Anaerolineales bacterium]
MLKALIFDFDGLILDTETPELQVWQKIYRDHGVELSTSLWGQIVGGNGISVFDPIEHLEKLTSSSIDSFLVKDLALNLSNELINSQPVLPGARELFQIARQRSLNLAIASSSPHEWVDGHLKRLGLFDQFDSIMCGDDVLKTKPFPDLFIGTLEKLAVQSSEAIVFEDSPNGIQAANAAGIFSVAVPNPVTRMFDLSHARLIFDSLEQVSLDDLNSRYFL